MQFKWNGNEAFEYIYSGSMKTGDLLTVRITLRFCYYKTRLYLLNYISLKDFDPHTLAPKQIIDSIKFKE